MDKERQAKIQKAINCLMTAKGLLDAELVLASDALAPVLTATAAELPSLIKGLEVALAAEVKKAA